jgi:hypothetical protein
MYNESFSENVYDKVYNQQPSGFVSVNSEGDLHINATWSDHILHNFNINKYNIIQLCTGCNFHEVSEMH